MKVVQPFIAFLLILIATTTCCSINGNGNYNDNFNDGGGGNENTNGDGITPETEQPIGNITCVKTRVESGRYGNITEVSNSRSFYNNESVRVRNYGKGRINFTDGSQITLYNNTSVEQVNVQVSPPETRLLLIEQGFQGYVPPGNTFTVNMPNGARVRILGTQFFVMYDQTTSYSIVGNFDGTVLFMPPGGYERELPPFTMVDIAPDGNVNLLELPYDPNTLDSVIDNYGSSLDGLLVLRKEKAQPFPGEQPNPVKPITTVFRHLVQKDGDSYAPDLAESWSVDPDGYIIRFDLRPGSILPNGDPFTSHFVRERLQTEWKYALEGRVKFEIIDDYTITFYLSGPDVSYVLEEMSIFEFEVQLGGPG